MRSPLYLTCSAAATKYIDETTPWVLAKDEADHDRLAEVLYNLTESITIGAGLLHSFLPETAEKIVNQLNTTLRDYDDLDKFGLYESGKQSDRYTGNLICTSGCKRGYAESGGDQSSPESRV